MLDGIFIGAVATAEMRNAMIIMLVLAVGVGELLIHSLELGDTGLWWTYLFLMAVRTVGRLLPTDACATLQLIKFKMIVYRTTNTFFLFLVNE
eukprot:COSAG06_NODE_11739_length_1471_cov_1.596210_2_plen_93_part_00